MTHEQRITSLECEVEALVEQTIALRYTVNMLIDQVEIGGGLAPGIAQMAETLTDYVKAAYAGSPAAA